MCLEAKGTQQIDIGVEAKVWDIDLFDYSQKLAALPDLPIFKSCSGDDQCANKNDGWYCSDVNPGSGYKCANKSFVKASPCTTNQYCQRNTDGTAQTEGDAVKCGPSKPEQDVIEALTCVKQTFPGFSAPSPTP